MAIDLSIVHAIINQKQKEEPLEEATEEELEQWIELKKKRSYHKPKRSKNPQSKLGNESGYLDEKSIAEIRLGAYERVKVDAEKKIKEIKLELAGLK